MSLAHQQSSRSAVQFLTDNTLLTCGPRTTLYDLRAAQPIVATQRIPNRNVISAAIIHPGVRSSAIDLHNNTYMVALSKARAWQRDGLLSLDLYDWRMLHSTRRPIDCCQPPDKLLRGEGDDLESLRGNAPYMDAAGPSIMLYMSSGDIGSNAWVVDAFQWAHRGGVGGIDIQQPQWEGTYHHFRLSDNGRYLLDWNRLFARMYVHATPFGIGGAEFCFGGGRADLWPEWEEVEFLSSVDMVDTLVVAAGNYSTLQFFEYGGMEA